MQTARLVRLVWVALLVLILGACGSNSDLHNGKDAAAETVTPRNQWTPTQAKAWYDKQPWLAGANYIPANASNQFEMWQADTFDEATIDKELGWAAALGLNTMRVFLHDQLWANDPKGFFKRLDRYLEISNKHGIRTLLVLFDGVWDPEPVAGVQKPPIPYTHNSRWAQSPGRALLDDSSKWGPLRDYVQAVIKRYRKDPRVVVWDIFNEGDNLNPAYAATEFKHPKKVERALALAEQAFKWARAVDPMQPITACAYNLNVEDLGDLGKYNAYVLQESDVVSFHSYNDAAMVEKLIGFLATYDRPMLCTEWMARPFDSTFATVMPVLKKHNIAAWHWGLVAGKTQTNYHWASWVDPGPKWAQPWFHDLLHGDGTPYKQAEVDVIKKLTGVSK